MDVFNKYNKMLPGGKDKKIVYKGYESLDQKVEKFNEQKNSSQEDHLETLRQLRQIDHIMVNKKIPKHIKQINQILPICKNIIKDSNFASKKKFRGKQEELKIIDSKMYMKRWDNFRERRTEAMKNYIKVIKLKKMTQFYITMAKLAETLAVIQPNIKIIKKKKDNAFRVTMCVIRMYMRYERE